MIPAFIDIGAPWKVLPPGIHNASMQEIQLRFAITEHRQRLFRGFRDGVTALCLAGCRKIYLDGSYITEKDIPNDYDACWDLSGVDAKKLDPIFLDFSNRRKRQKERFCGEFFPASLRMNEGKPFSEFFQTDRHTGKSKGIISVELL